MNHTERDVALSKALSSLLRHNATRRGVAIRPDGFCVVSDVLHSMGLLILGATVEDVQRVTRNSSKGRFELRNEQGVLLVCATQGHSMAAVQDALLLRQLGVDDADLPGCCIHGTFKRNLPSIFRRGLLPGAPRDERNHVHFLPFEHYDFRAILGLRHGSEVATLGFARVLEVPPG